MSPIDTKSEVGPTTTSTSQTTDTEPTDTHGQASLRTQGSLTEQVDRYALYERAVQCPEAEVDFVAQTFLERRGRPARSLIEDFCGTAAVCHEWVLRHPENRALGVDNDPGVLAYAREHRLSRLSDDQRARLRLLEADVTEVGSAQPTMDPAKPRGSEPTDLILAMNFSWWLITERSELLRYFGRVRERLAADGLFMLDAYGGYDAFRVITEERSIEDDVEPPFTYIWDQTDYNPISGLMECAIHFQFQDGSRIDNAFRYRWRLWTLPELQEILTDAGFRHLRIYWQGWDDDGEPDGCFKPVTRADADAGWICYLSAEP
ncbi:class I SAM-dependent methyltransferase [Halochromatium sp.]